MVDVINFLCNVKIIIIIINFVTICFITKELLNIAHNFIY
jgi:hypothetical protein